MSDAEESPERFLLREWELQQEAYIRHRELRFGVVIDAVRHRVGPDGVILDLGCGTGSLSARLLDALPGVTCIGIDHDPVLLRLATTNLRRHEERFIAMDADLAQPGWSQLLDRPVHAAASSTALHWLPPSALVALYGELASVLPLGGLLVNADHLRQSEGQSLRAVLAANDDATQQRERFASGVLTWERWWDSLRSLEGFAESIAERERRFAGRADTVHTSAGFHQQALTVAGFAECGTLWQYLDDFVVYGVR